MANNSPKLKEKKVKINPNYHKDVEEKILKRISNICKELPPYVNWFINSIRGTTLPRTQLGYLLDIRLFLEYLHTEHYLCMSKPLIDISESDLDQLTARDFDLYMGYLRYYELDGKIHTNDNRSIKRKMCALRVFFAYLFKHNDISKNETTKVDLPKIRSNAIIRMDANEIADFLDTVEYGTNLTKHQMAFHEKSKTRDLAIMTLMLSTGIRVTECVGLNINDIDFNNSRIKITRKGGYEAFVFFSDEASAALHDYLVDRKKIIALEGHEDALFLNKNNSRLSVRSVEKLVKKYSQIATPMKHITPHKLRSTYGTALYNETGDIYLVADVLGHKDVNTTKKHYADMSENNRRRARNSVTLREPRRTDEASDTDN